MLRAARTGFASGHRGGTLVVAFTVGDVGLVALSQQVSDVNQTADLVERRILIAAALALLVAMLVGWASAHAVTRRLSHLEQGARRIALGRVRPSHRRPVARRAGPAGARVRPDADPP